MKSFRKPSRFRVQRSEFTLQGFRIQSLTEKDNPEHMNSEPINGYTFSLLFI